MASDTYVLTDDILVVTKCLRQEYLKKLRYVLHRINEANMRLKFEKCKIAEIEVDWLGVQFWRCGVKPFHTTNQETTENEKKLKNCDHS